MIVIPQLSPEVLRDMEVNFGSTIAKAIWARMVEHINWIDKHFPVGMVVLRHDGITAGSVSWPIPAIRDNWQFCNGDPIVHPQSPMLGQNAPDLRGKFLKQLATQGLTGGTEYIDLSHNHGGLTGFTDAGEYGERRTDTGDFEDEKFNAAGEIPHPHSIGGALGNYLKVPPYYELQPYMRVA